MVGLVLVFGLAAVAGNNFRNPSITGWSIVFVVCSGAALWWRRIHPRAVFAVVVGIEIMNWFLTEARSPSGLAVAFAVFAVSAYDRSTFRRVVVVAAVVVMLIGVALLLFGPFPASNRLIPAGALSVVAWMAGDYVRSRRNFLVEVMTRHQRAREQAAEEERLRIARELHDVVAHNVSVLAIQAGAARVSGKADDETLAAIELGARDTLSELNRLLGVLRKAPGAPVLAPQPTLEDAGALLATARDAGLEATLRVTGAKRPLPAAVDLSAYRIVQEAVTNVLKHAHATRVEVVFDYAPDALRLTVSDNGSGPQSGSSNGHGLVGMRERVGLFGGELATGTSPLGGFTVHATLPLKT